MMAKLTVVLLLLATGGVIGSSINAQADASAATLVYNICQHTRITTVPEQTCDDAQDYYGIEYLCQDNNTSTANHCWTEVK